MFCKIVYLFNLRKLNVYVHLNILSKCIILDIFQWKIDNLDKFTANVMLSSKNFISFLMYDNISLVL